MNTELLETLAWVLIHSVWQGAVIASGVAAIGSTLSNPRIRHALALAGLGAVGAWSVYSALSIGAAEFEIGPMADGVSPAMASAVVSKESLPSSFNKALSLLCLLFLFTLSSSSPSTKYFLVLFAKSTT